MGKWGNGEMYFVLEALVLLATKTYYAPSGLENKRPILMLT